MSILKRMGEQRPILTFVILAYGITWAGTIPLVLISSFVTGGEFSPILLIFLPLVYGPTIAAIIMTRLLEGKGAVKNLLKKYLIWRVGARWYLLVVGLPLVAAIVAVGIVAFLSPGELGQLDVPAVLGSLLVAPLGAVLFGPLPEELGWRGYALPRLLQSHNPLVSSLIVGTIWTFWHTPMFFFTGATFPSVFALTPGILLVYWGGTMASSILYTVVLLHTRGSVLMAVLLHTFANVAPSVIIEGFSAVTDAHLRTLFYAEQGLIVVIGLVCAVLLHRLTANEQYTQVITEMQTHGVASLEYSTVTPVPNPN